MNTETEMSSFWWNFHHWLHWKLSKWQLPVQPVIKISSKWRHFRFSEGPKSIDPTMTKLTSPHLNKWGQMNAFWVVVYLSHWDRDNLTTISQTIFSNAFCWMIIQISLKFIPKGPIDNMPALIQILAWRRMATSHYLNQWWPSLLTHVCVTRP